METTEILHLLQNIKTCEIFYAEFSNQNDYLEITETLIVHSRINDDGLKECIILDRNTLSFEIDYYTSNHELVKQISYDDVVENQIIDLSELGMRWEGSSYCDKPCGFGYLFDGNNELIYKGFFINDRKVLIGKEFYLCHNIVEYEGTFWNGLRHGVGFTYSIQNILQYQGIIFSNSCNLPSKIEIPDECDDLQTIHNFVEEITIGDECYNSLLSLVISRFSNLQTLSLGFKSFCDVENVIFDNLPQLSSLCIHGSSFTNKHGNLRISNCPIVQSISIGSNSFVNYTAVSFQGFFYSICWIIIRTSFTRMFGDWNGRF